MDLNLVMPDGTMTMTMRAINEQGVEFDRVVFSRTAGRPASHLVNQSRLRHAAARQLSPRAVALGCRMPSRWVLRVIAT